MTDLSTLDTLSVNWQALTTDSPLLLITALGCGGLVLVGGLLALSFAMMRRGDRRISRQDVP